MTPDAWTDDDGPRFEKLRHNRKFHGRGPKHNPLRGMMGANGVSINKVAELVDKHARRSGEQANRARNLLASADDVRRDQAS